MAASRRNTVITPNRKIKPFGLLVVRAIAIYHRLLSNVRELCSPRAYPFVQACDELFHGIQRKEERSFLSLIARRCALESCGALQVSSHLSISFHKLRMSNLFQNPISSSNAAEMASDLLVSSIFDILYSICYKTPIVTLLNFSNVVRSRFVDLI